jgi:hypothetical protein
MNTIIGVANELNSRDEERKREKERERERERERCNP